MVFALAVLHSACFLLAYPDPGIWWLAFIAPIPLALACLLAVRARVVFAAVTVSQLVVWAIIQGWMRDVTLPGYLAFVVYLSLLGGLEALFLRALVRGRLRLSLGIALPLVLVGMDWLRGYVLFDGYPWYLRGQPLIEFQALAELARLGGVWLPTFVALAASGLVAEFLRRSVLGRVAPKIAPGVRIHGMLVVLFGVGTILLTGPSSDKADESRSILMVQTNLSTSNKIAWTYEQQQVDVRGFIELTTDALDAAMEVGETVDLVVWPETMLPSVGFERGDIFTRAIEDVVARYQVPMLIGSGSYLGISSDGNGEVTWEEHYNSAYLVGPSGPPYPRVDKIFLTPFGETMPYISSWPWLEERMLAFGAGGMSFDLDAGNSIVRPELPGETPVRIAVPICFEDTMATVVRRMVWRDGERAADLLVNISNDGWFGDDDAGRRMHTLCARWRSIENDVWLVRVANTGESVVIDPNGRIRERVTPEPRSAGTRLVRIGVVTGDAPAHALLGNLFGMGCGVAMFMALMVEWGCRRRSEAPCASA